MVLLAAALFGVALMILVGLVLIAIEDDDDPRHGGMKPGY